jgi:probable selenium-dependent hydroxylase accessory protein YqeC
MVLLVDLLELPARPLIVITGAGGKTTTMYGLAGELVERGRLVLTGTTTQIFPPEAGESDMLIVSSDFQTLLDEIRAGWRDHRHITVAAGRNERGKLLGLAPEQCAPLLARSGADALILEADGARHLKIKAPAHYEPVVPLETTAALVLFSAEALDQPLNAGVAHRPERIAAVTGISEGDLLTPAIVASLLASEQGGLRGIPMDARVYVLVTHAGPEQRRAVEELASLVRQSSRISGVLSSARPGDWLPVL